MKLQLQINGVIKAESAFHFTKFGFIKSLHDIRQKEIAEALQRFKKEYAAKYLSQDENWEIYAVQMASVQPAYIDDNIMEQFEREIKLSKYGKKK